MPPLSISSRKYMPEFGRLTCLVQHEFFHQYTVDEHTLICIEKLDGLWEGRWEGYKKYREVFEEIDRPATLYLALLLHDAGKGIETDRHEREGERTTTTRPAEAFHGMGALPRATRPPRCSEVRHLHEKKQRYKRSKS